MCIDSLNDLKNHYYLLNYWLQISHAINCRVRLDFDISEGMNIENAIQGICDASVAHLELERKKDIYEI